MIKTYLAEILMLASDSVIERISKMQYFKEPKLLMTRMSSVTSLKSYFSKNSTNRKLAPDDCRSNDIVFSTETAFMARRLT